MNDNQKSILLKALSYYGVSAQEDIAIEEMSELIKAILKVRRALNLKQGDLIAAKTNLFEEIADVEICIEYLKMIFEIIESDVRTIINDTIDFKIDRIEQRLKKEKSDENGSI